MLALSEQNGSAGLDAPTFACCYLKFDKFQELYYLSVETEGPNFILPTVHDTQMPTNSLNKSKVRRFSFKNEAYWD